MKLSAIIWLLIFCQFSLAQAPNLTNWKIDTLPMGDLIYKANQSENDWLFVQSGDTWEIVNNPYSIQKGDSLPFSKKFINKKFKLFKGRKFVKKTSDGYLIGFKNGEFSGSLYFMNLKGRGVYEIEKGLTINNFFEFQSRIYAIEGLYFGKIIEIFKENGFWKTQTVSNLYDIPKLIANHNNEKLIVGSQYIFKFGKELKPIEILKSPFYWGMLYPSSILIDNQDFYLSMRQGVLKIKKFDTNPTYEWFTPK